MCISIYLDMYFIYIPQSTILQDHIDIRVITQIQ